MKICFTNWKYGLSWLSTQWYQYLIIIELFQQKHAWNPFHCGRTKNSCSPHWGILANNLVASRCRENIIRVFKLSNEIFNLSNLMERCSSKSFRFPDRFVQSTWFPMLHQKNQRYIWPQHWLVSLHPGGLLATEWKQKLLGSAFKNKVWTKQYLHLLYANWICKSNYFENFVEGKDASNRATAESCFSISTVPLLALSARRVFQ